MKAYLNELSCIFYEQSKLKEAISTFMELLKILRTNGFPNIFVPNEIEDIKIISNNTIANIINDRNYFDKDNKALFIGMLLKVGPRIDRNAILEKYEVSRMECKENDCLGLGRASEYFQYGNFTISFDNGSWNNTKYDVNIYKHNPKDEEFLFYKGKTNNAYNTSSLNIVCPTINDVVETIPNNGKVLAENVDKYFPNLIFNNDSLDSLREEKRSFVIENIIRLLKHLDDQAGKLNRHISNDDIPEKITPEHETRASQGLFNFTFPNDKTYNCEWHGRYTPGAGRIHFHHKVQDHKIYIGYIGDKIGM